MIKVHVKTGYLILRSPGHELKEPKEVVVGRQANSIVHRRFQIKIKIRFESWTDVLGDVCRGQVNAAF